MTLQMYLLEHEMETEARGRIEGAETVALNLIRRGRPLQEIHEDTGLPIQRIQQLAKKMSIKILCRNKKSNSELYFKWYISF